MSPSATPAAQSAAASRATKRAQARHPVPWVPRLPRKTTVDVRLCHACHVKPRWMSPSATPATQSAAASHATKRAQARRPVPWVPRLPRKTTEIAPRLPHETKVDVTKCHACHAKCRASGATKRAQARHPVPWVPRLPRKTTVDVRLCHACHLKLRWMSPSATPATQSAAASRATKRAQARHPVPWVPRLPRLPRKTTVDVRLFHACHVKLRWMSASATLATQSAAASRATKRAQARHPVPWVPRLPRETKVDVRLRHACHAKWRWMSPSATGVWKMVCQKVVCERWYVTKMGVKDGAWWCVTKLYVQDGMWQRWVWKMVCERWYVTKLYVKDGMWQRWYVTDGVWKMVCQKVWQRWCVTGGRREAGGRRPGIQNKKKAKRIGTRPSALHSTFHFWRKSRRIVSFLLSISKNEEVSQNCFVFDVVKCKNK